MDTVHPASRPRCQLQQNRRFHSFWLENLNFLRRSYHTFPRYARKIYAEHKKSARKRVGASGHGLAGERDIRFTLQFFRFVCRGRCLHRPAGAPSNAFLSGLTQQITLQWQKIKHFSTRKKSYKNTGIILEKRLTLRLWYGKV